MAFSSPEGWGSRAQVTGLWRRCEPKATRRPGCPALQVRGWLHAGLLIHKLLVIRDVSGEPHEGTNGLWTHPPVLGRPSILHTGLGRSPLGLPCKTQTGKFGRCLLPP